MHNKLTLLALNGNMFSWHASICIGVWALEGFRGSLSNISVIPLLDNTAISAGARL